MKTLRKSRDILHASLPAHRVPIPLSTSVPAPRDPSSAASPTLLHREALDSQRASRNFTSCKLSRNLLALRYYHFLVSRKILAETEEGVARGLKTNPLRTFSHRPHPPHPSSLLSTTPHPDVFLRTPKPCNPEKPDSLDPFNAPRFLLSPSPSSRSPGADPFPKAPVNW